MTLWCAPTGKEQSLEHVALAQAWRWISECSWGPHGWRPQSAAATEGHYSSLGELWWWPQRARAPQTLGGSWVLDMFRRQSSPVSLPAGSWLV